MIISTIPDCKGIIKILLTGLFAAGGRFIAQSFWKIRLFFQHK